MAHQTKQMQNDIAMLDKLINEKAADGWNFDI